MNLRMENEMTAPKAKSRLEEIKERQYESPSPGMDHLLIAYDDIAYLLELVERYRSVIFGDGYNSVRETLALMAEGEGSDYSVYMEMAQHALAKVDSLRAGEEGE